MSRGRHLRRRFHTSLLERRNGGRDGTSGSSAGPILHTDAGASCHSIYCARIAPSICATGELHKCNRAKRLTLASFRVSSEQSVQRIPNWPINRHRTAIHREVVRLDHGTPTTTPCSLVSKGEYVMQKHALALGYFFLAVFCIFTCSQGFLQLFYIPLLLAALAAALMGLGFLLSACAPQFPAVKKWLVQMVRMAQEPPVESKQRSADGQSAY